MKDSAYENEDFQMCDKKRYTRIIPLLSMMYFLALICRNNVGYAFNGMSESFQLSDTVLGLVGGIFFIGYLLLQIPGGHFAHKFSAKKIITICMFAWASVSIAMGFIQSGDQLIAARFALGLAQSMLYPTSLILLAKWFPMRERARAIGYFGIGATAASFVVGPLSGLLVDTFSWQMLFVIEAIPVLVFAWVWIAFVAEKPEEADFLTEKERNYLLAEFEKDRIIAEEKGDTKESQFKQIITNKYVWLLTGVFFLNNMFNYGLSIWWPTISSSVTGSSLTLVGMLSAIAPLIALGAMYVVSGSSDRTGERKLHAAGVLIICGIALLGSSLTLSTPFISIAFILLAQGLWGGFSPVFWSIPPIVISVSIIGAATGMINGLGNLGGFAGPYLFGYLIDITGSTQKGLMFIVAVQLLAGVLLLTLKSDKLEVAKSEIKKRNMKQAESI